LEAIPLTVKANFARDVIAAGKAIDTGVVAANTKARQKYWRHWSHYAASLHVNPLLQDTPALIRDTVLTAFAARVRTGYYGKGRQVKVQSVTDALSAISKTIELAGLTSPVYRAHNVYTLPIQRCIEGMRREDPPAVPQLAIPVEIPTYLAVEAASTDDPKTQAIGDLSLVAFFYLLRVGEYTKPRYATVNGRRVRATRTVQFTVASVGFFKDNKELSKSSPLAVLLDADYAVLRITNQKNGRMGDVITHETHRNNQNGPVQALARRVFHILNNGGTKDTLLCDFITHEGIWHSITPDHMRSSLRKAALKLKFHEKGIDPRDIGVHSLRAGGAMALKMMGVSDTIIKKQGRWTSMTFLEYIHNQLAIFAKDLSRKMSTPLPYLNVSHFQP